ncbi:histidine phosphatase family protein [Mesorhizobium sp. 1B3]|uniref:histidine phosphatase family protein n=1 Tax=Mesorhizobium sp. 1B3 TaxID=3243599 RepID=UPI003D993DA1
MTTTFFLVRHAAHDNVGLFLAGRCNNVCLGTNGRAQAERLAERMQRERFTSVTSSPRERARETAAAIVAASQQIPLSISNELDEIDFGCWSGKTFQELDEDAEWRRWNAERNEAKTPGGETMLDVERRILTCMRDIAAAHPNEGAVLVSHADVIKAAVCHVLDLPPEHAFRFDVDPASITTLVMGGWGAKLLCLNETVW